MTADTAPKNTTTRREHDDLTMTTGNHLNTARRARPTITLSEEDYERLSALAYAARNKQPELAAELAEEVAVARARERRTARALRVHE